MAYKVTVERIDETNMPPVVGRDERVIANEEGGWVVYRPVYMQVFDKMSLETIIKNLNGVKTRKRRSKDGKKE